MNENRKIALINTLSKGFSFPKDKANSPLIIELPTNVENINFPNNILKMEVFVEDSETKMYYASIYIGEVHEESEIRKAYLNYLYSEYFDIKTLKDITPTSKCAFYKDQIGNMLLLAKLDEKDLVVSSLEELQVLINEMSVNERVLKDAFSRTRKNDNINLIAVATFGKDFQYAKDEKTSPLVINMPAEIETLQIPKDILQMDIYEIINNKYKKKELVKRIYIGEVYTLEQLNKICPRFRFSLGMDFSLASDLQESTSYIVYKNDVGIYCILAKLRQEDIVLKDTEELKDTLTKLSTSFSKIQDGMSRIRNLK